MDWFTARSRKVSTKFSGAKKSPLTQPRPTAFKDPYEKAACQYLVNQGLSLVEANYRCRAGEIDLIMRHGNALVFVEVRFRKSPSFGGAIYSVTRSKQKKIMLAAQHYLLQRQRRHDTNIDCRFDVIAVSPARTMTAETCPTANDSFDFNWVQSAFCT